MQIQQNGYTPSSGPCPRRCGSWSTYRALGVEDFDSRRVEVRCECCGTFKVPQAKLDDFLGVAR